MAISSGCAFCDNIYGGDSAYRVGPDVNGQWSHPRDGMTGALCKNRDVFPSKKPKVHMWRGKSVDGMTVEELRNALKQAIESYVREYEARAASTIRETRDLLFPEPARQANPPRHSHGLWCDFFGCDK